MSLMPFVAALTLLVACPITAFAQTTTAPAAETRPAVETRPVASRSSSGPGEIEKRLLGGGTSDNAMQGWQQTVGALAVVVVIILILRLALKKVSRSGALAGTAGGAVEVLARSCVLPRQHLLLVRLGRRLVLLGSGPNGLTQLSEVTDPREVSDLMEMSRRTPGAVAKMLARTGTQTETNDTRPPQVDESTGGPEGKK